MIVKTPAPPQSATSLPRSPRDDAGKRFAMYLAMMGIRVGCFVAMVLITPYGWYTWLLGLAAVFLPYVAVVFANVGADARPPAAVSPERALEPPAPPAPRDPEHPVIRVTETRSIDRGGDA